MILLVSCPFSKNPKDEDKMGDEDRGKCKRGGNPVEDTTAGKLEDQDRDEDEDELVARQTVRPKEWRTKNDTQRKIYLFFPRKRGVCQLLGPQSVEGLLAAIDRHRWRWLVNGTVRTVEVGVPGQGLVLTELEARRVGAGEGL